MDITSARIILLLGLCTISSVSAQCPTNKYGTDCRFDCHCAPDVTCDPSTGCTDTTTCADGWDGPTCQRQNVARGCSTSQSSTWTVLSSAGAVDGISGHNLGLPCAHTGEGDSTPSWSVTLNQTYAIYRFRIYNRAENRGDRLNRFNLSVRTASGAYSTCYRDSTTDTAGPGDIVDGSCQTPITGDIVKIETPKPYLTLCEVLLYVCSNGTYGEICDKYCGKCWNKNLCDKISGICPLINGNTRCAAGYRGELCDQVCMAGTHGEDCKKTCGKCWNTNRCDKISGICPLTNGNPRCAAGYRGNLCDQECMDGSWGDACKNKCGQCLVANSCSKQNGVCPLIDGNRRCAAGYRGDMCNIGCDIGFWGEGCVNECGQCSVANNCSKVNGVCLPNSENVRCAPKFKKGKCVECVTGLWGEHCDFSCGNCLYWNCEKETGECPLHEGEGRCKPGFKGAKCTSFSVQCSTPNKYGDGCRFDCHCAPGVTCDPNAGCTNTTKCADGWDGPTCQRQNVASGGKTSQSSTYLPDYSSAGAVDGKSGHYLGLPCTHTGTGDLTPSWSVTLNQTYDIYRFRIYNRAQESGSRLNGFTLSVRTTTGAYSTCYQDSTTDTAGPGDIVDGSCQTPITGDIVKIEIPTPYLTLCEVLLYVCCDGTYGNDCDKSCGECWNKNLCDKISGQCPLINGTARCAAGYRGDLCDQGCELGFWGEGCGNECGQCSVAKNCNNVNGVCYKNSENVTCVAKFKGDKCVECVTGRWGEDCELSCGNCLYGNCEKETGECTLREGKRCKAGYKGTSCSTVCTNRTWGSDCLEKCGKCSGNAACETVEGECPMNEGQPLCEPGYTGKLCNTPCIGGTYGLDCVEKCGFCAAGTTSCHGESGACPAKQYQSTCLDGYTGKDCKTEVPNQIGTVVGLVIAGIVVVALVAVIVMLYRRRRQRPGNQSTGKTSNRKSRQSSSTYPRYVVGEDDVDIEVDSPDTSSTYENEISTSVPVDEFAQYVQEKKASGGFVSEFEKFLGGLHAQHKVADLPHNKDKSRYKGMVAYDHSRVILKGGPKSDYINACYIDGHNEPRKFIASQGPTALIIEDFVRMIWERKVERVVMVTNLVEAMKTKCVQYWPSQGTRLIGAIDVTLREEEVFADFTTRNLHLSHSQEKGWLEVKQFHFTTWPDHGVPSQASALLDFRNKVLAHQTSENGPIVVHCSAGVGRTGTFIALDYLINQANSEAVVDVQGCVRQLRKQRVNMVQTKEQYEFLHEAVAEAILLSQGSIPLVDFSRAYANLCAVDPTTEESYLAAEFKVLGKVTRTIGESTVKTAMKEENASKNRSSRILAADSCRPFLSTPVTGSNDYINAVFLPGYKIKRGFLLTQTPLPNTVLDFWRLVYEQSVSTIVMLDHPETQNKSVGVYLPEKLATMDPFQVEVVHVEEKACFSLWTYQLTYKNTQAANLIKHIRCKFWSGKPSADSISSLLNVIQFVEDWQKQTGSEPVLVYCRDGVTKSGLYCAASSVIERIKVNQDVSIVQTLKQLRACRPSIVVDMDQFNLLHQIVLGYLESFNAYANFSP